MAKRIKKGRVPQIGGLPNYRADTGADIRMNVLVYGLSGIGKTRFIGSADKSPLATPMLLIDVEGGTLSIAGSKITIVRPTSFKQIQEIYDFLRHENDYYKSVGVDSVTELQRKLSMGEITGTLDEDSSYKNLADHTPTDRYGWLQTGEQMRKFIRAFRDLAYHPESEKRIHVFMTALEKSDDVRQIVCPSLPGLLGLEIGASMDVLARMSMQILKVGDKKKKVRQLRMSEWLDDDGTKYLAKARVPETAKFPKELWRPTVQKLLSNWMSEGGDEE